MSLNFIINQKRGRSVRDCSESQRLRRSERTVCSREVSAVLASRRVAQLAARSERLRDAVHGVRRTLGLQLVIGECVLDSWLDLGVALVVSEARINYLVIFDWL